MVSLGPLHRLPGGARVEGDEGGEVGRSKRVLSHPFSKLAGQVHSSQSRNSVEVSKICLNLDTKLCLLLATYTMEINVFLVDFLVKVKTFRK